MRTVLAALALVLGRLRADRVGTVLLFVLMLVTAFVFSAGPMLLNRVADEGLRQSLASAAPSDRSLQFSRLGSVQPGPSDALEPVAEEGAELEAGLPGVLRDLIETREFVVESIPYLVIQGPRSLTHIDLRYQSGIDRNITLVDGRLPAPTTQRAEIPPEISPSGEGGEAIVYEVAVSTDTLAELRAELGERILMTPDRTVSLPGAAGWAGTFAGIDIVGVYEVPDPEAGYWLNDWVLYRPTLVPVTLDTYEVYATALIAPEVYRVFFEGPEWEGDGHYGTGLFPFYYQWRYFLDLGRLHAGVVEDLSRQLTRLEATYPFRSGNLESDVPSLQTAVPRIIEGYRSQRQTTEAALAVAAVGPAGAAAGALALVALLQARRRSQTIVLVHGRGASGTQVLLAQLVEALLLGVPAAIIGYIVAALAIGARESTAAMAAGAAVVAGSAIILLVVALPLARAPLHVLRVDPAARLQSRARRLVFDGLLIAIAVVGVILLRSRGVLGGGPVDPYLAAVPALVGLAVGLAALRIYPIPLRALSWLAARARGVSAALGLRTAARDPGSTQLPLLVLILATSMGVFSSAVLVTVEEGQLASSYQGVGADFRIDAGLADIIPAELDVTAQPGVQAVAGALLQDGTFRGGQVRQGDVTLQAVDPAAYRAVVDGTPAAVGFPAAFTPASWPEDLGSEEAPIPAIVTAGLASSARLGVGATFELTMPGGRRTYSIAEVRDRFPGMPVANLVVVPRGALEAAFPNRAILDNALYVRATDEAEEGLRSAIVPFERRLTLVSRPQVFSRLHDVPLAAAVTDGLGLALAVTLAYSALALSCGLILALAARRRDMTLLRTMGLRARQVMALVLIEHGPVLLVALAVGVALGIGLAWLIQPGLQLEVFTGPGVEVLLRLDPVHLVTLGVVPVAIVAAGVLLGAWLVQRGELAGSVRSSAQFSERAPDE